MSPFNGDLLYKKVFSTNSICWFDEEYKDDNNINRVFLNSNKKVYQNDISLNIRASKFRFTRTKYIGVVTNSSPHGYLTETYKKAIYIWKEGNLYRLFKNSNKQQLDQENYAYMHLQSRKMKIKNETLAMVALAIALATTARAADRWWDGTDTTGDADGGSGTWVNGGTANWDDSAKSGAGE